MAESYDLRFHPGYDRDHQATMGYLLVKRKPTLEQVAGWADAHDELMCSIRDMPTGRPIYESPDDHPSVPRLRRAWFRQWHVFYEIREGERAVRMLYLLPAKRDTVFEAFPRRFE